MKPLPRKKLTRTAVAGVSLLLLALLFVFGADVMCRNAATGKIFRAVESIPANDVALVLGTSKLTARGNPNLHFTQRIAAAAELFHAGRVRHLIVSGDNSVKHYDEPTDMRNALAAAGVPTNAITCDYAGFRTLDSVVRAKTVFGLTNLTIVTEEFHCPRAVWIARRHGLNVVAFAAPDLSFRWSARVKIREALARTLCAADLYVLNRQPKCAGPPEKLLLAEHASQNPERPLAP
jgi:SanA protein